MSLHRKARSLFDTFLAERTGGHSTARIVRAHSDRARTASTSAHLSGPYPLTATLSLHILSPADTGQRNSCRPDWAGGKDRPRRKILP
jgi:hypothetical protein